MYYEEKVIDGVLCHRSAPDDPWTQFTLEALTIAFRAMKRRVDDLSDENVRLRKQVNSVREALASPPRACEPEAIDGTDG